MNSSTLIKAMLSSLHRIVTGGRWGESPNYLVHNLTALEKLHELDSAWLIGNI